MTYKLTQFSVRTYPFDENAFDERLTTHLSLYNKLGWEFLQLWHTRQSATGSSTFDYYNCLWKVKS